MPTNAIAQEIDQDFEVQIYVHLTKEGVAPILSKINEIKSLAIDKLGPEDDLINTNILSAEDIRELKTLERRQELLEKTGMKNAVQSAKEARNEIIRKARQREIASLVVNFLNQYQIIPLTKDECSTICGHLQYGTIFQTFSGIPPLSILELINLTKELFQCLEIKDNYYKDKDYIHEQGLIGEINNSKYLLARWIRIKEKRESGGLIKPCSTLLPLDKLGSVPKPQKVNSWQRIKSFFDST